MVFGSGDGLTRPKSEPADRRITGPQTFRLTVNTQSLKLPDSTVLTMFTLNI